MSRQKSWDTIRSINRRKYKKKIKANLYLYTFVIATTLLPQRIRNRKGQKYFDNLFFNRGVKTKILKKIFFICHWEKKRSMHKLIESNLLYHKSHSNITNDNLKKGHCFSF